MFKEVLYEDNNNKVIFYGKIYWCNIYKYKYCKSYFNIMILDDFSFVIYMYNCKRFNFNFNLGYI